LAEKFSSEQFTEPLDGESGIPDNAAHRKRVDWGIPGDRQNSLAVCHDDVSTFAAECENRPVPRLELRRDD
jgi:hypothetical protein